MRVLYDGWCNFCVVIVHYLCLITISYLEIISMYIIISQVFSHVITAAYSAYSIRFRIFLFVFTTRRPLGQPCNAFIDCVIPQPRQLTFNIYKVKYRNLSLCVKEKNPLTR